MSDLRIGDNFFINSTTKGPTESCPQGGWTEQNQVLSTESLWKGAKSSFHLIYTLINNDTCLFFTNVSENIIFGRFCENGSKWLNIRFVA